MRFTKLATGLLFSAAMVLPTGIALAGAPVGTPVLFGTFITEDESLLQDNCMETEFDGEFFEAEGSATGVGLMDDTVTLSWDQDFIDNVRAKDDKGKIQQKSETQFFVDILPGAASTTLPLSALAEPEKCKSQSAVKDAGLQARGKLSCKDVLGFLAPTPDQAQLDTIEAAFASRKDVKINNNGNVTWKHKGVAAAGGCGPF